MFSIDVACFAVVLAGLCVVYCQADRQSAFPAAGWCALGAVLLAEALVYFEVPGVPTVFTPIVMTAYVVAVDCGVYGVRGRSLMRTHPDAFVWIATLSIFLWIIFEMYNESLAAWHYGGLPNNELRYLVLGWSFAMIWSAVIETADFFRATVWPLRGGRRLAQARFLPFWVLLGVICLVLPVLLPRLDFGEHVFGLVLVGMFVLFDTTTPNPSMQISPSPAGRSSRSVPISISRKQAR